jgi:hypothetical protein
VLPSSGGLSTALIVPSVSFGTLHAEIFERMAAAGRLGIVSTSAAIMLATTIRGRQRLQKLRN